MAKRKTAGYATGNEISPRSPARAGSKTFFEIHVRSKDRPHHLIGFIDDEGSFRHSQPRCSGFTRLEPALLVLESWKVKQWLKSYPDRELHVVQHDEVFTIRHSPQQPMNEFSLVSLQIGEMQRLRETRIASLKQSSR